MADLIIYNIGEIFTNEVKKGPYWFSVKNGLINNLVQAEKYDEAEVEEHTLIVDCANLCVTPTLTDFNHDLLLEEEMSLEHKRKIVKQRLNKMLVQGVTKLYTKSDFFIEHDVQIIQEACDVVCPIADLSKDELIVGEKLGSCFGKTVSQNIYLAMFLIAHKANAEKVFRGFLSTELGIDKRADFIIHNRTTLKEVVNNYGEKTPIHVICNGEIVVQNGQVVKKEHDCSSCSKC